MTPPRADAPGRLPLGGGPFDALSAPPAGEALGPWLLALADRYEQPAFLADDPLGVVHAFDAPADREAIGLFAAVLAWGRRSTILASLARLVERMDGRPDRFVRAATPARAEQALAGFTHRTFTPSDAVGLTLALRDVLAAHGTVGQLVGQAVPPDAPTLAPGLQALSDALLASEHAPRAKHLARPSTGSACKRLAMYARWMTRPGPVDLGQWTDLRLDQLVIPLDVHTGRQARRLGLLARATDDWRAVEELTAACRRLSPTDPARLDFALFGLGAYGGAPLPPA